VKNGLYWIDPNQGSPRDSILAYCNFTRKGETCVQADKSHSEISEIEWPKSSFPPWFSETKNGSRISYSSIGRVQLTFLRLLADNVRQKFTLISPRPIEKPPKFRFLQWTDNGDNFPQKHAKIISLNCKNTKSGKCESIMEFTSSEPDHLPIVDFKPEARENGQGRDVVAKASFPSGKNSNFVEISGFRTGDLCFS